MVKTSIIIPTYNHFEDALKPCLESIIKYTLFINKELIIVANGCTDGTADFVKNLEIDSSALKFLDYPSPLGFPGAVNKGIESSEGEFIILLNNDIILLDQPVDQWVDMLVKPFDDPKIGITGPMLGYSEPADHNFIIFFCAAIKKIIINEVGLLDEIFSPGGGEDTDFCIRVKQHGYELVQVPDERKFEYDKIKNVAVGSFPIWHFGEATVGKLDNWQEIFNRNGQILRERHNRRWNLSNNCERAVIGKNDYIPPRENTRYKWAADRLLMPGDVLEIGCSSGYALRFLPENINYLGIDKDADVIQYAKEQFGDKFKVADIMTFDFRKYKTIIAFEVIEHLSEGIKVAQYLKKYCDQLLITVPYKEPVGLWGPHHKLHNLSEEDFPDFKYSWIDAGGYILDKPTVDCINLMLMEWNRKTVSGDMVTVSISTKDRYFTTLPLTINGIINQTIKPAKLLIFDDGEQRDLRTVEPYNSLFQMLDNNKIAWSVIFGEKRGQVYNHQKALEMADTEFIWRLDDDNIPESNVLEQLLCYMDDGVGAVGGLVINPSMKQATMPSIASNKIEDIFLGLNKQWFIHNGIEEVDHLYSSFLYRKSAGKHGYELNLTPLCFREETMFTYQMKRNGWKLILNPEVITWHLQTQQGGVRGSTDEMRQKDELIFMSKLNEWKIRPNLYKFIILDNGLGDHIVFKSILPEIKEKHRDKKIIIAVCYLEVFQDEIGIEIISIAEAKIILGNLDCYNVYKHGRDTNSKKHLSEIFKELYL